MTVPNYYELLGVEPDASPDEIRRAYRRQIHRHHPDKPGGDAERARMLDEARSVLLDPAARARYDRERAGGDLLDHAVGALVDVGADTLRRSGLELPDRGREVLDALGDRFAAALRRRWRR
jgi:curved DNA-binding protein CbpA